MSYTSIDICVNDEELQARVKSAASKEAWAGGDEFKDSEYGRRLRTYPDEAITTFMYCTSIDYEDEYKYALDQNNEHPGADEGVITDANIQASIQAHWPRDPAPLPTDMVGPTPGVPT
jgi:hypothetical protein